MNISFSETFKKVTSVTLAFAIVFTTLTPAAFAAFAATFTSTETTANVSTGSNLETAVHANVTANVVEVKATRTIDVQSLPANNSTVSIGTCVITFPTVAGSTSDELDCSDNDASIDRNTGAGNNARTAASIAGRIRAVTNIGSSNHGTLVVSWTGTEAIFTTAGAFTETTASVIGFSGTAAGASVISTNSVTSVIPVKQEASITIGGTIDIGDTFTVTSAPLGTASFVATTTSTSDVATGLNAAIQAHPNYPARNYTTSVAGSVITLTAKTAGTAFTSLTPTTTNFPWVAQVVTFTPATPTDGLTYRANINGTNYDYTVVGTKTVTEVVEALQPLMNAHPSVSCTEDDSMITCTADVPGTPFTPSATVVDITAPDIDDTALTLTVWPVTASGATVTYPTPVATDVDPVNPAVSCLPASGDTFPLGTTTVTCISTDTAGNLGTQTFSVTITDTEDPVLSLPTPDPVEVVAISSANVSYVVSATDNVDPSPAIVCSHLSGSSFNFGTTIVTCTATDSESNDTTGTFNVVVQDTVKPTLVITLDDTALNIGDTALVTFTFSEAPVGFDNADITVENATIDTIAGSGTVYTATLTPTVGIEDTTNKITVGTDWSDANTPTGNAPAGSTDSSNYEIDTIAPTPFTIARPSDNEVIEEATTNSEWSCETGATITITGSSLQTNPTTTTCVGGQFLTPITFIPASLDTTFNLIFTETDAAGNAVIKTINNIQYKTKVVTGGGSGPANTDFVTTNTSTPPAPSPTPTPTPTQPTNPTTPTETTPTPETTPVVPNETTPENPSTPTDNTSTPTPTPAPTPAPAPTAPTGGENTSGGTGTGNAGTGGQGFNPADATLDQGGGTTPEEPEEVIESPTLETTTDIGGGNAVEESTSYTLLWTLLGLIALLNTWWFFVAKNKPTIIRRD